MILDGGGKQEGTMVPNLKGSKVTRPSILELQKKIILIEKDMGGYKQPHVFQSSYSEKENTMIAGENQLENVNVTPNLGGWCKVEKKKGRKM